MSEKKNRTDSVVRCYDVSCPTMHPNGYTVYRVTQQMSQMNLMRENLENKKLLKQGAEAKIYTCTFYRQPAIVKERFVKSYRHPVLDKQLTTRRIRAEVKCIARCRSIGIRCPAVYFVDESNSIIMEYFTDCITVKEFISRQMSQAGTANNCGKVDAPVPEGATPVAEGAGDSSSETVWLESCVTKLLPLASEIGRVIGTMHSNHIIHGDLTTSNFLLVGKLEELQVAVIDFGLGSMDASAEDKGVDLYVLERALLSTHPSTEAVFEAILHSYKSAYGSVTKKGPSKNAGSLADEVIRKFNEIRLRGRKRTMVG